MASFDVRSLALTVPAVIFLAHFVPWLVDPCDIRRYPGPFLAKFSDSWLAYVGKSGQLSETIRKIHEKYGTIVRIAPNHISIADPEALNTVYGYNGALKSDFYDTFVSSVFSTRDRAEHTRKRKIIAPIFSQKGVLEFEPNLKHHVAQLIRQWDRLFDLARVGMPWKDGQGAIWKGKNNQLFLDLYPWASYLAFDIIGDFTFGAPLGMLEAAKGTSVVPKHQQTLMDPCGEKRIESEVAGYPFFQILGGRGEFSVTVGVLPSYWRPAVKYLPGYKSGGERMKNLARIANMAIDDRIANPTDRNDLLNKLIGGQDAEGKPLDRNELAFESVTILIAGSDTISDSLCAICYYLAGNKRAQEKLQKELDEKLGTEDKLVAAADQVKGLTYLDACINESLRLRSTFPFGLPRVVPKGGLEVMGQYFVEGTVLSMPNYTIHRDVDAWGKDSDAYRPERWFERDQTTIQKAFNPFSVGPRACVGRNLAIMELQIIVASLLRRYHFVLEHPGQTLETRDGFLRHTLTCRLGIQRRD